jgi:hypothetical protein
VDKKRMDLWYDSLWIAGETKKIRVNTNIKIKN